MQKDIQRVFDDYFSYVGDTEAPDIFHRWSFISSLSACLGRKSYVPLGPYKIIPNQYIILMGISGSRKTSAITLVKDLLDRVDGINFSADKTSKEKFILDLQELNSRVEIPDQKQEFMDIKLNSVETKPAECFIVSDELQDFLGQGNIDFITMLGKLWEARDKYENRIKTGQSSLVHQPTINLLGGNTPTGFSLTFPHEIVGQGFLSRLLLVHGDKICGKITWPRKPTKADGDALVAMYKRITQFNRREFEFTAEARHTLDRIYQTEIRITDPRFERYETRRFTHLLKLCAAMAVAESNEGIITGRHALVGNTLLYYIERRFSQALGEFGRSKFSDVSNAIMEKLNSGKPQTAEELWVLAAQDLSRRQELNDILKGLINLNKIQAIDCKDGKKRLAPCSVKENYFDDDLLLPEILTEQERITGGW